MSQLACSSEAPPTGSGDTGSGGATGGAGPGTGGAPGSGGSAGSGGATTGGAPGVGGSGAEVIDDSFVINVTQSPIIGTVASVEFSVGLPLTQASVQFGRTEGIWEYEAPVDDLAGATHQALLLGMKPGTTYAARIVAESGGSVISSPVFPVETGFLPNGLFGVVTTNPAAGTLAGGFTITCNGFGNAVASSSDTYATILDADGDFVWAYPLGDTPVSTCSSARMSFDGRHMWIGNFSNVTDDGALLRVTMDGAESESYSLPGRHHHFAILPNGHVLYPAQKNGGGCGVDGGSSCNGGPGTGNQEGADLIMDLDPETGQSTQLYDEDQDFAAEIAEYGAHTNYVSYVPHLSAVSFSMRHMSAIGLLSYPEGELLAVFNGPDSIAGFGVDWEVQHGHQFTEERLLVFNNTTSGNANILGVSFDLEAETGTVDTLIAAGGTSLAFGDVQQLEGGNLMVTYSTSGVIEEVDPSGAVLQRMTATEALGYAVRRKTLYGAPPPFGN